MVSSQNGWVANNRSVIKSWDLPGGRVSLRNDAVGEVLCYVARRFHAEVEALIWPGNWGYAERLVRGGTDLSNHASGTALDLNAPRHPLGTQPAANYSASQIAKIHEIVDACEGVVRWGGDYIGRKDGMHFEINDGVSVERVNALWAKLSGQSIPEGPAPVITPPAPSQPTANEDTRALQFNLNDTGFDCGTPDGVMGPRTLAALKAFQFAARIAVDGIPGPQTNAMLRKVPSWNGGNHSASAWQQKLKDHGWRITVDNDWGKHSASILKQFQAEKGITADGLRGPQSWTCLFCTVN